MFPEIFGKKYILLGFFLKAKSFSVYNKLFQILFTNANTCPTLFQTLPWHKEMVLPTRPVRHLSLLIVILAAVGSLFVIIALICFIKFVDELAGEHFAENLVFSLTQTYL